MSNPNPNPTTRFKPGHPGGPGRSKNWLKPSEVKDYIAKYCRMTMPKLAKIRDSDESQVIEVILAGVLLRICEEPDPSKLEYVLNRTIGKIRDEIIYDDDGKPMALIHRPDGTTFEIVRAPAPTDEPSE
jgi:hypothetical protein